MSPVRGPLLIVLAISALGLSGCVDPAEEVGPCRYTAIDPKVSRNGYAYTGQDLSPGNGTLIINANDEANTGTVRMNASVQGSIWTLEWNQFTQTPGSDFQDGGIVRGIDEHGDSGIGDTNIPKVFMLCAAWGAATMQLNGQPFNDPHTGSDTLSAHFMVLSEGIRDDQGRITKTDLETPYDPNEPSDGQTRSGDQEVILQVKSPAGAPPLEATQTPFSDQTMTPVYNNAFPFDVTLGSDVMVNVSLVTPLPVPTGQLTFRVLDVEGAEEGQRLMLGGPTGATSGTIEVRNVDETGEWSLAVAGQALLQEYSGTISISPPGPTFLVFHFERYTTPAA